ncbi:DEAD/DEAH box helicase [Novosphingobium sp. KN65.2]|uniref:DEAD/DEAH box helicase n=1 Tax=Novosphingobium sp. KN65.2 TaxID=1478134 RepID=UPI0005E302FE|nr:helicase [Novosphingobium sp. KN65.2]CDO35016.1 Helicase domain protein [Novosphingobium sp. KN65.2]
MNYAAFLERKAICDPATGLVDIDRLRLPECLFPHQRDIVRWALRRGRAALFAGTGLGKSLMELSWAQAIHDATGKSILHLAPLAVSAQMVREAEKFGIPAHLAGSQDDAGEGIAITNYQKLDHFDLSRFGAVILDESSILKNVTGHYRSMLIAACRAIPFRLAATATPAPNDFMELGNHAEFLGVLSYTDMLATFFIHDGGDTQKWRLKGHAENEFWRWMATWAVMLRKPSDLGYCDDGYDLPPLTYVPHIVPVDYSPQPGGTMFPMQAATLQERISARRESVVPRCELAASITPSDRPFVWWCNLNAESELLTRMIPGAVETRGSDSDDVKERKLLDFSEGRTRVLVTKPGVAGFGMNWQHCADTGFVGLSDSFEQFYQAVRRFWRFGQASPVIAHVISSEIEGAIVANIRRKEADAERMAAAMVRHMSDLSSEAVRGMVRERPDYQPMQPIALPSFLSSMQEAA